MRPFEYLLLISAFSTFASACVQTFNSSEGVIGPPNYFDLHDENKYCTYIIQSPTGKPFLLTFTEFNIQDSRNCSKNYVEILEAGEDAGRRLCGTLIPRPIVAVSGYLTLKLYFERYLEPFGLLGEFRECSDCVQFIEKEEGFIQHFTTPDQKLVTTDILYLVKNPNIHPMVLQLTRIELDGSEDCMFEYLQVKEGLTYNSPVIGTYCGNQSSQSINIPDGEFSIHFHSEEPYNRNHGFIAVFKEHFEETSTMRTSPVGTEEFIVNSTTSKEFIKITDSVTLGGEKDDKNQTKDIGHHPRHLYNLEGNGNGNSNDDKSKVPTTVIYVVGTVGFCLATVCIVNGVIVWRRRKKRRRLATRQASEYNFYGAMRSSLGAPDGSANLADVNIIYNENYDYQSFQSGRQRKSSPCVITPIDNVDSETPSVITNMDEDTASSRDSGGNVSQSKKDYAIEDGSYYVLTVTSSGQTNYENEIGNKEPTKSVDDFEDDSVFHSTETSPDGMFDHATLKITDI